MERASSQGGPPAGERLDRAEHAPPDDEYYVLASSLASRRRKHVLADGDTFAVLDQSGDVPTTVEEEVGLFYRGTRHLSVFELLVGGIPPFFLSARVTPDGVQSVANLTNGDLDGGGEAVPRSTVSIRRSTFVCGGAMLVRLGLHSFSAARLRLRFELRVAADFRDVFEVRGVHRARSGEREPPRVDGGALVLGYRGLDGVRRVTRCAIAGAEARWEGSRAFLDVEFGPREECTIDLQIDCAQDGAGVRTPTAFADAAAARARDHRAWEDERAAFQAADDGFASVLAQAMTDVFTLTAPPEAGTWHDVDRYVYAGIPWYATIFGRDGLITARQLLAFAPGLARSVLRVLAALQGKEVNAAREEQPGKIVHEARYGEMAATGEVPFGRYYGSVDATPLFCMLLGDYARTTGDVGLARELWPNALAALDWIKRYGDRDGDGYVEYQRMSDHGLINQGWKDSGDAIFHRDGSLAEAPIALVEVQGYCYAALHAMADVAEALGEPGGDGWRRDAAALRDRINADFWIGGEDTYALALDRDKQPCAVVTSNPGHLLYCGVPDGARAERLAARLLRTDLFCGWGIRTLASGQARYNPMSYHNGSIWPHDNSLIAAGLRRYGRVEGVLQVLSALVEAALQFEDRRLPELFCGFGRRRDAAPVPYPVACRPQAWAAGSVFLLLEAALGLELDAFHRRVVFRQPQLPAWLAWLELRNVRVGTARLDVIMQRGKYGASLEIVRKDGDVEIVETR